MAKKLYQLLNLNDTATPEEITKAYRKKALLHHPDKHSNDPEDIQEKHGRLFREVIAAYEILNDKEKRNLYDTGQIDEKGHPIINNTQQKAPRPEPSFRMNEQTQSTPHAPKKSQKPTYYYFFASTEAARAFETPPIFTTHIYIVPKTPLVVFFNALMNLNNLPENAKYNTHGPHYHQAKGSTQEHVAFQTWGSHVEKMLDKLLATTLLFELNMNQPSLQSRGPAPRF